MSSAITKAPNITLNAAVSKVCHLIRESESEEKIVHYCDRLLLFLDTHSHSREDLEAEIRRQYEPKPAADWIAWFAPRLYPDAIEEVTAPSATTALQPQDTLLQPERIERRIDRKSSDIESRSISELKIGEGIAHDLAVADRHIIVAGDRRDTADFLRAIAMESLYLQTPQLKVIDCDINPWLGFHCDKGIVTYASIGVMADLVRVVEAIRQVWAFYQEQTQRTRQAVRAYKTRTPSNPVLLIINRWDCVYGWIRQMKAADLEAYQQEAETLNIDGKTTPAQAAQYVNAMASADVSLGVRCCLGVQRVTDKIGLSAATLNAINATAISSEQTGYGATLTLLADKDRFPDSHECRELSAEHKHYQQQRHKVLITNAGMGRVMECPPYEDLRDRNAVSLYRYAVSKTLAEAS